MPVGRGRADLGKQGLCRERFGAGHAEHMLGQHIERAGAFGRGVLRPRPHRLQRRAAFQHLEPVGGHEDGTGAFLQPVIGAADALHEAGRALGRAQLMT